MALAPMLLVQALDAYYGRAKILHGVSFEAKPGEIVALAGRNGAGKSTTLKAIMGLVPPSAGRIIFEGRDITGLDAYRIARMGVGFVPEDRRIFTELTVAENLAVGARPITDRHEPWSASSRSSPISDARFIVRPGSSRVASSRCSPSREPSWATRASS